MSLPQRKTLRLPDYDYAQPGAYFITMCVKDRKAILSNVVGGGLRAAPKIELSPIGIEVEKSILYIHTNSQYNIEKYVIMPNHIHLLAILPAGRRGGPPLPTIIGRMKSYTTRMYNQINRTTGLILWQRSYHDHIIRNEDDYRNVWQYIDANPQQWETDRYYQA